jgi:hypothetical protein
MEPALSAIPAENAVGDPNGIHTVFSGAPEERNLVLFLCEVKDL